MRGALRPGGSGREWCDVEVLRRIRRASVARLRREVEAVEQPALARFTCRPGTALGARAAVASTGCARCSSRSSDSPLAPEVWERQVLPLRMDYQAELLDQLCTSGEVVRLGAHSGRVAISFRRDATLLGPPGGRAAQQNKPTIPSPRQYVRRWPARVTSPSCAPRQGCPRPRSSKRSGGSWPRASDNDAWERCGARAGLRPRGRSHRAPARAAHAPPSAAARRGTRSLGPDCSAPGGADRGGRPATRARGAGA